MKNSIAGLILLIIAGTIAALAFVLYENNIVLKNQISQRDILIKRAQTNDSLSCAHDEKYVQTVTKYITSDCSLLVDGRKISLDNFLKIYSQKEDEAIEAQKNLNIISRDVNALQRAIRERDRTCDAAQDSLSLYKYQLLTLEKRYGIVVHTRSSDKYWHIDYEAKKIDSALVLLSIYRKRMSYDSLKRTWSVRVR